MRNPKAVLDNLNKKTINPAYKFERLYRNLYNQEFYFAAYQKIYAKEGNMTRGTDGHTIDGMSLERIDKIIERIKNQSYQPAPSRRVYISKGQNRGKRPLGIPSIDDKLVQEIVRNILEAVFEPTFSNNSHGFRRNRSCHTALTQATKIFKGVKWWVEGDIKGFFDNIDHHILIKLLKRKIKDEKFINLIWKFLRAGYLEDWKFNNTYSGTPQGGIISPILSNIYLNELDKYIEEYKTLFDKGTRRQNNIVYTQKYKRLWYLKKKFADRKALAPHNELTEITSEVKRLQKDIRTMSSVELMDSSFKRIQYVRYADDFLIGIIGSKQAAEEVKKDLTAFLKNKLNLELSSEKTLITHGKMKARFLGYDVTISNLQAVYKGSNSRIAKRYASNKCEIYMPKEKWIGKLKELKVLKIEKDSSWKSIHRAELINSDNLEILSIYNSEIRGLYNYYKLAKNVHSLQKFRYIMKFSMVKTFASKYKLSVSKIMEKFNHEGNFRISYTTKTGQKHRYFYNEPLKRVYENPTTNKEIDIVPNTMIYAGRNSLIKRLKASKCEWCQTENTAIEMHHVKKLKELKGKQLWEKIMIARNRKTLALCKKCHVDLHAGRLD